MESPRSEVVPYDASTLYIKNGVGRYPRAVDSLKSKLGEMVAKIIGERYTEFNVEKAVLALHGFAGYSAASFYYSRTN